jgi:hypothetical protein
MSREPETLWYHEYDQTLRDLTARSQLIWTALSVFFATQGVLVVAYLSPGAAGLSLARLGVAFLGLVNGLFLLFLAFGERYRWSVDIERIQQLQSLLQPTLYPAPDEDNPPVSDVGAMYSRLGAAGPGQDAIFALAASHKSPRIEIPKDSFARVKRHFSLGAYRYAFEGYRLSFPGAFAWSTILIFLAMYGWSFLFLQDVVSNVAGATGTPLAWVGLILLTLLPVYVLADVLRLFVEARRRRAELELDGIVKRLQRLPQVGSHAEGSTQETP